MLKSLRLLLALCALALPCAGCVGVVTTMTEPAPVRLTSLPTAVAPMAPTPADVSSQAQMSSEGQMPMAIPIWTSTPLPEPTVAPPTTQPPLSVPPAPPQPQTKGLDASLVASVNGVAIPREAYELRAGQAQIYLLQQPGVDLTTPEGREELQQLREGVLQWMVDEVLIQQAAAARGLSVSDADVERQVNEMRGDDATRFNKWLAANGMTMDQLRKQIRADQLTEAVREHVTASLERTVPQVRLRHILVSEESAAQEALARIRNGEPFVVVARAHSEDAATRESGGELGYIPRGVMPLPFEEAAFALQPGQVSEVVRSESGLHIIQAVEADPAREISDELWPVVQQNAFERWLAAQRANADLIVADVSLP